MTTPKIRFVYQRGKAHWGSTTMRAHQLCNIANMVLGDRYDFSLTGMPGPDIPGWQRA